MGSSRIAWRAQPPVGLAKERFLLSGAGAGESCCAGLVVAPKAAVGGWLCSWLCSWLRCFRFQRVQDARWLARQKNGPFHFPDARFCAAFHTGSHFDPHVSPLFSKATSFRLRFGGSL